MMADYYNLSQLNFTDLPTGLRSLNETVVNGLLGIIIILFLFVLLYMTFIYFTFNPFTSFSYASFMCAVSSLFLLGLGLLTDVQTLFIMFAAVVGLVVLFMFGEG